jgi:hypothetical protein
MGKPNDLQSRFLEEFARRMTTAHTFVALHPSPDEPNGHIVHAPDSGPRLRVATEASAKAADARDKVRRDELNG